MGARGTYRGTRDPVGSSGDLPDPLFGVHGVSSVATSGTAREGSRRIAPPACGSSVRSRAFHARRGDSRNFRNVRRTRARRAGSNRDMRARREPSPGTIGAALRHARVRSGLSQRTAARRIARAPSVVNRWESGDREPTLVDIVAIGRVLGVDPRSLLDAVAARSRGRTWSCRANSPGMRRAIGARLRAARLGAGVAVAAVVASGACGGLRLRRIEQGADASVAELVALRGLVGFDPRRLVERSRLDVYADLSSLRWPPRGDPGK